MPGTVGQYLHAFLHIWYVLDYFLLRDENIKKHFSPTGSEDFLFVETAINNDTNPYDGWNQPEKIRLKVIRRKNKFSKTARIQTCGISKL